MKAQVSIRKAGFTLTEVIIATTISVLVIGGVTMAFIDGLKIWQQEEIRNELNFNLEVAMENIRTDLRLSSVGVGLMSFYPSTAAQYTAISMPISLDANNDGYLDRDTNSKIVWNETVIYHVRPGEPSKLLRSVYYPRCQTASANQVYQQLSAVVASSDSAGLAAAAIGSETSSSKVVFENLVDISFSSSSTNASSSLANQFDCYAPTAQKAPTYNFGSLVLNPGSHTIELTVTGKNSSSSGYYVPIDKFQLSASASDHDAELFYPINQHPASPCFQSTISGGAEGCFQSNFEWSGQAGLMWAATAVGQKMTFSVSNDCWTDNNFETPQMVSNCQVVVGDTNYFPADIDVQMIKGITWSADHVGSSNVAGYAVDSLTTVSNTLYATTNNPEASLMLNGCWARFCFQRGTNLSFLITNAWVQTASGTLSNNITFSGGSNSVYMSYDGPTQTNGDWMPMWVTDMTSDYVVRYQTYSRGSNDFNGPAYWQGSTNFIYSTVNGISSHNSYGLASVEVGYPRFATFRSRVYDTLQGAPTFNNLNYTELKDQSNGGDLNVWVRSGNNGNLSAAAWNGPFANQNVSLSSVPHARFVQYEARFECGYPNESVPSAHTNAPTTKLLDVTIDWPAVQGLVDLQVDFGQVPNGGIVSATVDGGQQPVKGLQVGMTIYKAGRLGTNTASGILEIRPLNTGR